MGRPPRRVAVRHGACVVLRCVVCVVVAWFSTVYFVCAVLCIVFCLVCVYMHAVDVVVCGWGPYLFIANDPWSLWLVAFSFLTNPVSLLFSMFWNVPSLLAWIRTNSSAAPARLRRICALGGIGCGPRPTPRTCSPEPSAKARPIRPLPRTPRREFTCDSNRGACAGADNNFFERVVVVTTSTTTTLICWILVYLKFERLAFVLENYGQAVDPTTY